MSTETTNQSSDAAPSGATAPSPATTFGSGVLLAVLIIAVGMGAAVPWGWSMMKTGHNEERAAFESVLQMPSEELENKSVAELRGHLDVVKKAGNYSLAYGNVTGYDKDIVEREYNQINDLIKQKTDN